MTTESALDWADLGRVLKVPPYLPEISTAEFSDRWDGLRKAAQERDMEAVLVTGNEAEFSSLRYLTNYWPIFESAAVMFGIGDRASEPVLLIGPESESYARDRSRVPDVRLLEAFRESADPSYPEVPLSTFRDVFASIGLTSPRRIGIGGSFAANLVIMEALRDAFPSTDFVRADDVVTDLRQIKSEFEIQHLRRAFAIAEAALDAVLDRITPGMTELQVVGIAQASMYANGAEYEGMPQYVLSGPNTAHAISRPGHRVLEKGDLVQLNISARVGGYSSGVGRPVSLGPLTGARRELVEFCREAHRATETWLRPGEHARTIAENYYRFFKENGRHQSFLYGPCTGLGLMETEGPWIETNSDFVLQENMAFQLDTFAQGHDMGVRWENGAIVRADGPELLSGRHMDPIEINA